MLSSMYQIKMLRRSFEHFLALEKIKPSKTKLNINTAKNQFQQQNVNSTNLLDCWMQNYIIALREIDHELKRTN